MSDFLYRIDPIVPVIRGPFRMCPVGIDLDYSFAIKARSTEMPEEVRERFIEFGNDIAGKFLEKQGLFGSEIPYHFIKESWLLHYCSVFGNAAGLGLDDDSRIDFLEDFERTRTVPVEEYFRVSYSSYNIDTKDQALCALNLWLTWANLTKSMFDAQNL